MNYEEFLGRVERSITNVVRRCHPASWDENHITFSLVDQLFNQHKVESIEGLDRPFKIVWDFRKLRRPEESDLGDIAVLVKLTSWAGETTEGVGLLEAKRRELSNTSFSAAHTRQLRQIRKTAPSAQLLLYDYDNVTSCMDNCVGVGMERYFRHRPYPGSSHTHCVCVPMGVAIQRGQYNTDLHKFGIPLSYQLCSRYFRGFDLEYEAKTLEAAKGNIARHGGARYLILVGVSTGTADPTLPEANDERYSQ